MLSPLPEHCGGFNHYRAALSIDIDQWKEDEGKQISTPTLVLWGKNDPVSPVPWTNGFDRVFTKLDLIFYPEWGTVWGNDTPRGGTAVEPIRCRPT